MILPRWLPGEREPLKGSPGEVAIFENGNKFNDHLTWKRRSRVMECVYVLGDIPDFIPDGECLAADHEARVDLRWLRCEFELLKSRR